MSQPSRAYDRRSDHRREEPRDSYSRTYDRRDYTRSSYRPLYDRRELQRRMGK